MRLALPSSLLVLSGGTVGHNWQLLRLIGGIP